MVIIREELHVEDNILRFLHSWHNYTLSLEYKNEKFYLVNSDNKIASIEDKNPDEVKRLRL